ncbi:MAG: hypothetical protein NZ561_06720, partial [Phycisphaerae bacterium]|nr:hypothetical protein [Phycisphaerae bacterium]MDW8262860.1 hypothetical protein [Phycisphaerales bacterium]
IESIHASAWRPQWSAYEHPNNTTGHLVFACGARGHYLHTHDAARNTIDIQIHGPRGALRYDGRQLTFNLRPQEQLGESPLEPVELVPARGEADLLRDFHAYITTGAEPGISVRHNLETMAACEMMCRSIALERVVTRGELDR